MNTDVRNFHKTVKLNGTRIEESNFMIEYQRMLESLKEHNDLKGLTKNNLDDKINPYFQPFENLLKTEAYDIVFKTQKKSTLSQKKRY